VLISVIQGATGCDKSMSDDSFSTYLFFLCPERNDISSLIHQNRSATLVCGPIAPGRHAIVGIASQGAYSALYLA